MKVRFFFLLGITSVIFLGSCARVYFSPEAKSLSYQHRVIAVAPPKVTIAASRKTDPAAIQEQQKVESLNFQKEMVSWLLRRKMQNKIFVEVVDAETVNAKLQRAGYFDGNPMTPKEICEVLGVDGLITSNYSLTKPISEGAALAVGLLTGAWASTNTTNVNMEIHDRSTGKLIWNYNHQISGSVGSTPAQLVDNLMRNASRKLPYNN
jgi:hypothetical protein